MRHLTLGSPGSPRRPKVQASVAALVAVAVLGSGSAAKADVPGFEVKMGQAPATFTIGKNAKTLTAVASTDRGRRCLKVRWALTIETKGVSLDQIRVTRVENGQSFAVRTAVQGEAATVIDERLDPGQLCRDRTVTGEWQVAFIGPDNGEVSFQAQAFDGTNRLLSSTGAQAQVVTPVAATPSKSASPSPSPSPSKTPEEEAAAVDDTPQDEPTSAAAAPINPVSSSSNVLGIGLIVGALMVFLGIGMLLRLRLRNRRGGPAWQTETQSLPTGFYNLPDRRRR